MHTVIRQYRVTKGDGEALAKRIDKEFLPVVRKLHGFVAYLAVQSGADRLATISVFESEAGCTESTKAAAKWLRESAGNATVAPPEIFSGKTVAAAGDLEPAGQHSH